MQKIRCVAQFGALYPIISQMERAAGFTHDDNTQVKLDKLDALLAKSFTPAQDAALLADMLSLPNDGRYPTLELDPQRRRQKTLEALTAQLEALALAKPVLMIFEDVHWIDPTSLEAVGRSVDRLRGRGVLLIITYRPEFEPPWIGSAYVTALNLSRLGDREIAALINQVTGNKPLSQSIRQDIIERTDGIPCSTASKPSRLTATALFSSLIILTMASSTCVSEGRDLRCTSFGQIAPLRADSSRQGTLPWFAQPGPM
jgi:predicted ATPase